MKKTILLSTILIAGVVSAFPFRTSCGQIVMVNGATGSLAHIENICESINFAVCGTYANVILYTH
ncbi:hypothetical protein [Chryseobacterium viscerum]|uniref:Uncharacterized protein n=1 Tax=Chryseobacterium viscerum TaxID=1037377 RepID=A0A316WI09_9FLAO|nr:hypothetical protein [Chryseobacterium viscerum]KAB1232791.1 hypothetical protein F8D52_03250 [Chryseobacterium viscerum]PWN61037.1 hypothetical protein C1634_013315 [Chryseobacterium viscerum]